MVPGGQNRGNPRSERKSDFWAPKVTFRARGDFGARSSHPHGTEDDEAARAGPHTVRWGGRRRTPENLCRVRAAPPHSNIDFSSFAWYGGVLGMQKSLIFLRENKDSNVSPVTKNICEILKTVIPLI